MAVELSKLIKHYRKKAIGYRTVAKRKDSGSQAELALNLRASIWEDVAEDLDAWLADQEEQNGTN